MRALSLPVMESYYMNSLGKLIKIDAGNADDDIQGESKI